MVLPNAKSDELAPKLDAVVVAAPPNVKGAEAEAGVDDAPPPPKANGFGAAAEELKADWAAGASNDDFPNANVDWVVAEAAVEAVLAKAKPPKVVVVVFWLGAT